MLPYQPAPARRPGGAAAGKPARWRPRLRSTLVRARHGQRRTTLFPSGPMQAGDHAAHRPRRHVDHWPRPGRPATPSHPRVQRGQPGGSAADTGDPSVRTPGCTGRLDTGRLDTGRLDTGCPLDRLDGRPHDGTVDADNDRLAGVRTFLATGDHPLGGPTSPGHGAWGRSASHDGSG
jgi:hypothetical protein